MRLYSIPNSKAVATCVPIILFAWICYVLYDIPSDGYRFLGIVFLTVGIIEILLHKQHARRLYNKASSLPPIGAKFWEYLGEDGIQILYLGIGIALATGGLLALILSLKI